MMFAMKHWRWPQRSFVSAQARRIPSKATRRQESVVVETLEPRTLPSNWTALGPAPIVYAPENTPHSTPDSDRFTGIPPDWTHANTLFIATPLTRVAHTPH